MDSKMQDNQKFINLLNGKFDWLPEERRKIVRIFLSSTFSDTKLERDHLIEKVYPKLQDYCKGAYGLDFQVVDLRWGIFNEALIDHITTEICLSEIENCKTHSIGPYFIALLSHRYGTKDIPNKIDKDEFEIMQAIAEERNHDLSFQFNEKDFNIQIKNIFNQCFQLDENEEQHKYKLLRIDKILPGYDEENKTYKQIWNKLAEKICSVIEQSFCLCVEEGLIIDDGSKCYGISVTQREIELGIFDSIDKKENVLYFERRIVNLDNIDNLRLLEKYRDNDEKIESLLNKLKNKIKQKLPSENIIEYEVNLIDSNDTKIPEIKKNELEVFGNKFHHSVKKLIDRNARKHNFYEKFKEKERKLIEEIVKHAKFSKQYVRNFYQRDGLLIQVKNYIGNDSIQPFIIHGICGIGKTSIMAKIANGLQSSTYADEFVVILRFLGTTLDSSNIEKTYYSITYQLERILQLEPNENKSLLNNLYEKLRLFSVRYPNKKLIIILDSIHQLNDQDKRNLNWIIKQLPKNIKMILSTLTDHNQILEKLKKIINNETQFLKVDQIDLQTSKNIISNSLNRIHRSLSETQWMELENVLKSCNQLVPLLIKLLFDTVRNWTSFSVPSEEFKKIRGIDDCIAYLFDRLEREHGKVLFSRCLFYMNIMRKGISENELADVLSLDDDLLSNIFIQHHPPIRRFPMALWARIKYKLNEYLVEKDVDDILVIAWYHSQLTNVAIKRYIFQLGSLVNYCYLFMLTGVNESNKNYLELKNNSTIIQNAISLFAETWKNKEKPYTHSRYYAQKFNIPVSQVFNAYRYPSNQAFVFVGENGKKRLNKRKLNELPHLTAQTGAISLLRNVIFYNYQYLYYAFQNDLMSGKYLEWAEHEFIKFRLSKGDELVLFYLCTSNAFNQYFTNQTMKYDADLVSPYQCALISAYPYLQPFEACRSYLLDSNKVNSIKLSYGYIFICSNRHMYTLRPEYNDIVSEINFPNLVGIHNEDEDILKTEIYFNRYINETDCITDLWDGGYVIMSKSRIMSFKFTKVLCFSVAFNEVELENIYFLPDRYLIVQLKNENYFFIYDVLTGEVLDKKVYKTKIRFILCAQVNDTITINEKDENYFLVILENGEVEKYEIKAKSEKNFLRFCYNMAPRNVECYDAACFRNEYYVSNFYFVLTFYDGEIHIYKDRLAYDHKNVFNGDSLCIRPNLIRNKQQIGPFKIQDCRDYAILVTDIEGNLYFYKYEDEYFRTIPGRFQLARLSEVENLLVATSDGTLYGFFVSNEIKQNYTVHKVLTYFEFKLHQDEITRLIYTKHGVFTISKDCTHKFMRMTGYKVAYLKEFFHYSKFEPSKLINLQFDRVLTYSENSKGFDIWDCNIGEIEHKITLDTSKIIKKIIACDNLYFILAIENDQEYVLKALFINKTHNQDANNIVEIKFPVKKSTEIQYSCDVQLHKIDLNTLIVSKNYIFDKKVYETKIYLITWSTDTGKPKFNTEEIDGLNEFLQAYDSTNGPSSTIAVSNLSKYLVVSKGIIIYIYDLMKKIPVSFKQLFSSPESIQDFKIDKMYPIEQTDDFIAISNNFRIFYIAMNPIHNDPIQIINTNLEFSKVQIMKHLMASFDRNNQTLFVYDLKEIKLSKLFPNEPKFKMKVNDSTHFSLSPDCCYLALFEMPRYLKLYRLKDSTKIADVLLYSSIYSLVITDKFVSMGMKDKRVLSYLIVDPLEGDHKERIKQLPTRSSGYSKTSYERNKDTFNTIFKSYSIGDNTASLNYDFNQRIFDMNRGYNENEAELIKRIEMYPLYNDFEFEIHGNFKDGYLSYCRQLYFEFYKIDNSVNSYK